MSDEPQLEAPEHAPFSDAPDTDFEVLAARPAPRAAAPTLGFRIRVTDGSSLRVFTIALTVVITVEPSKRSYDPKSRDRLVELFGEPERWSSTTTNFRWAQAQALVPGFTGSTEFELEVPCSYDLELAAAKYFHGLDDGAAPLRFHFNGTVFYESEGGRMQIVQIAWDRSPRFGMPIEVWRQTIDSHYPFRGWVPVHTDTLARLSERKERGGLPTFDAVLEQLLERTEGALE